MTKARRIIKRTPRRRLVGKDPFKPGKKTYHYLDREMKRRKKK